jgi:hypothetical protein
MVARPISGPSISPIVEAAISRAKLLKKIV